MSCGPVVVLVSVFGWKVRVWTINHGRNVEKGPNDPSCHLTDTKLIFFHKYCWVKIESVIFGKKWQCCCVGNRVIKISKSISWQSTDTFIKGIFLLPNILLTHMINLSYHLEWKKCGSNEQITSKILGQRTWKCIVKYVFAGAPCISHLLPRNHEKGYNSDICCSLNIHVPCPNIFQSFGSWAALWTKANGLRAELVCSLWAEEFEPMQDPPGFYIACHGIMHMMEPQGRRIGYALKIHA